MTAANKDLKLKLERVLFMLNTLEEQKINFRFKGLDMYLDAITDDVIDSFSERKLNERSIVVNGETYEFTLETITDKVFHLGDKVNIECCDMQGNVYANACCDQSFIDLFINADTDNDLLANHEIVLKLVKTVKDIDACSYEEHDHDD